MEPGPEELLAFMVAQVLAAGVCGDVGKLYPLAAVGVLENRVLDEGAVTSGRLRWAET